MDTMLLGQRVAVGDWVVRRSRGLSRRSVNRIRVGLDADKMPAEIRERIELRYMGDLSTLEAVLGEDSQPYINPAAVVTDRLVVVHKDELDRRTPPGVKPISFE